MVRSQFQEIAVYPLQNIRIGAGTFNILWREELVDYHPEEASWSSFKSEKEKGKGNSNTSSLVSNQNVSIVFNI